MYGCGCDLRFVSSSSTMESGTAWWGRLPWEEAVKTSVNIQLARFELVMSKNRKHGTGMDHITSAPTTHPVTQVGYTGIVSPPQGRFQEIKRMMTLLTTHGLFLTCKFYLYICITHNQLFGLDPLVKMTKEIPTYWEG
jgi:hypothetical protein